MPQNGLGQPPRATIVKEDPNDPKFKRWYEMKRELSKPKGKKRKDNEDGGFYRDCASELI